MRTEKEINENNDIIFDIIIDMLGSENMDKNHYQFYLGYLTCLNWCKGGNVKTYRVWQLYAFLVGCVLGITGVCSLLYYIWGCI